MAFTQQDLSTQMIAQLQRLDPSVSAQVGTPERKILDTVAQALADSQIDLAALQQGLDIDSKYGDTLDRFLALFGFGRQKATFAQGFVTFSRTTASTLNIIIPANTQLRDTSTGGVESGPNQFYTTTSVTLNAGAIEVVAPISARVAGTSGNVAANTITQVVGNPVLGITGVINEVATKGGVDSEDDDEYKLRFKNTVFRNLAGTRDQYLALAVATQYSLKANVIGPQSVWREYIQIPPVDDSQSYDVNGDGTLTSGNGNAGEYSTGLSSNPYMKYIWTSLPAFISSNVNDIKFFYRPDIDFRLNIGTPSNRGDGFRFATEYASLNFPSSSPTRANITFLNTYTGVNPDIQAVRPGDLMLLEFNYMSDASRNDIVNNITNAVDVYVDGGNDQFASTILQAPSSSLVFVDDPTNKLHYENFRRHGQPTKRPLKGSFYMPLYWTPITGLPSQISVGDNTYTLGTHYWLVHDTSLLGGSIRSRSGIEWSSVVKGISGTTPRFITEWIGGNFQPIEIDNYTFDQNIVDLQAALEGSKQITTDVLAHRAVHRYFKFDITVMYVSGSNLSTVNQSIHDAVDTYLKGQYFGTIVQLSDILDVIHNVDGVDNVRWTSDTPTGTDLARVYRCDASGRPLLDVTADDIVIGTVSNVPKQAIYITGQPQNSVSGHNSFFIPTWNGISGTSVLISSASLATDIGISLNGISGLGTVSVAEDARTTTNVAEPIRSFTVTWGANGAKSLIVPKSFLKGGSTILYNDFVIRDNELPGLPTGIQSTGLNGVNDVALPADSVPGFIIRTASQNTFLRG